MINASVLIFFFDNWESATIFRNVSKLGFFFSKAKCGDMKIKTHPFKIVPTYVST